MKRERVLLRKMGKKAFSRGMPSKVISDRKTFLDVRFFLEFQEIQFSQFCPDTARRSCLIKQVDLCLKHD